MYPRMFLIVLCVICHSSIDIDHVDSSPSSKLYLHIDAQNKYYNCTYINANSKTQSIVFKTNKCYCYICDKCLIKNVNKFFSSESNLSNTKKQSNITVELFFWLGLFLGMIITLMFFK